VRALCELRREPTPVVVDAVPKLVQPIKENRDVDHVAEVRIDVERLRERVPAHGEVEDDDLFARKIVLERVFQIIAEVSHVMGEGAAEDPDDEEPAAIRLVIDAVAIAAEADLVAGLEAPAVRVVRPLLVEAENPLALLVDEAEEGMEL